MTLESKEHLRNKVNSRLVRERKSAKEIQEVLDSLRARPLEYAEYKAMPQDIASWHEFANSVNVDKALQAHRDEQRKTSKAKDADISRQYVNQTPEENAACQAVAEQFTSRYKHFLRIPENSSALADRMKQKNLNPLDVNSFIRAFEELAVEGRIVLDGKIAGICEDAMVGGHELRTHKELYRFLKPTPTAAQLEQHAAAKLSADQWKASRPELQDGIPFIIQQQFFKAAHSLASFEPEYVFSDENNAKLIEYVTANKLQFNLTGLRVAFNALKGQLETTSHKTHGQVVTLTEHDPQPHGAPALPDKASLRAKIRNLNSTQLAQFFADNPGARAAVDSL